MLTPPTYTPPTPQLTSPHPAQLAYECREDNPATLCNQPPVAQPSGASWTCAAGSSSPGSIMKNGRYVMDIQSCCA